MAGLTHWNPFRSLSHSRRDDFDDFIREAFRRFPFDGEGLEPAVDIAETDKDVTVTLQVPGVEKDQLHVTVRDDVLEVRGEVKHEEEEKKKHYYRQEIRYGSFQRSVRLPSEVDGGKVKAELKNGVLRITAPKVESARTHTVNVAVS